MQFTMQDLESNLFEDTSGAPTPPTHINDHLPNQLTTPRSSSSTYHQTSSTNYNIGTNYSSDNIMYPTPPSQENCQPNTPPDTLHSSTDLVSRSILPRHDVINTSSASFSANTEVADCSNLEQVDEMKSSAVGINAISVRGLKNFCSTIRCTKFPAPSNYSPLTFLSLTNTFNKSYVPSWKQVSFCINLHLHHLIFNRYLHVITFHHQYLHQLQIFFLLMIDKYLFLIHISHHLLLQHPWFLHRLQEEQHQLGLHLLSINNLHLDLHLKHR